MNQPPLQVGFPGISFGHKNPPPSHNPQPQAQPWPGIFEQYIGGCRTIAAFDGKHSKQINVKGCSEMRLNYFGGNSATKKSKKVCKAQPNSNSVITLDPCCMKVEITNFGGSHVISKRSIIPSKKGCCVVSIFGGGSTFNLDCI